MMIVFVLVAIAFALMFGHGETAKSLVRPFIGLVLAVSIAPAVFEACARLVRSGTTAAKGSDLVVAIIVAGLVLYGRAQWHHRTAAGHGASHGQQLRHRQRALPPPPAQNGETDGQGGQS